MADTPKTPFSSPFQAGEYVFREGDPGNEMFIIQEGQVEIVKELRGEERQLAVLEEGDFFGEMAVLEEMPRLASARALTDCVLLRIDASTFDQMVRHNPEIPVRMLRKLSGRLREANLAMTDGSPVGAAASSPPPPAPVPEVRMPAAPPAGTGPSVVASPAPLPAPPSPQPVARPRLLHPETGTELPLPDAPEVFIGRPDAAAGFQPDIDLKPYDTKRSTSRRHARIVRREGAFFVREEMGVSNGTFVNDQRVPTGTEVPLADGDEVRFGLLTTRFLLR
ncbi:MAG: cyclic nucleotide-binding domain-containing protein [Acidobacteriota bacterium]